MNQDHFLWHLDERPEGCRHHRLRRCLLKGCERLFWPRHPRSHYCREACVQAARYWQRWRSSQQYRATENGKQQRREQSKRYRKRMRERQAASPDVMSPHEGQRKASEQDVERAGGGDRRALGQGGDLWAQQRGASSGPKGGRLIE